MPHTKIICTIGPSVNSVEKMTELMRAGMNVARLNFSHGTHDEHLDVINKLKEARKLMNQPLAIMLDTKGPEIRLGLIKNNYIELKTGQRWLLTKDTVEGNIEKVSITPSNILDHLSVGSTILFDDGYISSHIVDITPEGVVVEIDNGGPIRSRKGVNIPNVSLPLPAFTEKDIEDIKFGCKHDINLIAASFVRSADHVMEIKQLLEAECRPDIVVLAKIENREGVENFDSIIQVADGVMIARGDLGVELPIYEVPSLQKMMIRKAYLAEKPSVTATQMLESMINNPRPTRAEVSDIANAIYDSTSAVMLSGETAVGSYPMRAVNVMRSVIEQSEMDFDYRTFFDQHSRLHYHDVASAVTLATVKSAYSSNAKAIFCFTITGTTARLISRLRPYIPIIAMTDNEHCYHQMSLYWGVIPYLGKHCATINEAKECITRFALEQQLVTYGDLVLITVGTPFGVPGTTNTMMIESIGEVLVRGEPGYGGDKQGVVTFVLSCEIGSRNKASDKILVITRCDEGYESTVKNAAGVILQNQIHDHASEDALLDIARRYEKSVIIRADRAMQNLKEGQPVRLDPQRGLVFHQT